MGQTLGIGDVVTLNSGGPRMTVCKVDGEGAVHCIYFSEKPGAVLRARFEEPDVLSQVQPAEPRHDPWAHDPRGGT